MHKYLKFYNPLVQKSQEKTRVVKENRYGFYYRRVDSVNF